MSNIDNFAEDLMNAITESEIEIDCPNCEKEITFKISDVGSSITCPYCKQLINLESE
ncbi:MAG: hypothetical protein NC205_00745 [Prevotella sp.]|nr:hypothetical protein [Alistipes senegalensis]MCM1357090.1 hypothetical protein [Prevotella sp.]MCM1472588.1 hypothetical protein [Muribaculaceae bacterium]